MPLLILFKAANATPTPTICLTKLAVFEEALSVLEPILFKALAALEPALLKALVSFDPTCVAKFPVVVTTLLIGAVILLAILLALDTTAENALVNVEGILLLVF